MNQISSEDIQKIDDQNSLSFLNDHDKVEVALTLLVLKPAFKLSWWEYLDKEEIIHSQSLELAQLLNKNNFITQSIYVFEDNKIICNFYCANNQKTIDELIDTEYIAGDVEEVVKNKDEKRGILLGYPLEAVKDYINNNCVVDDLLPDTIKFNPIFKFVGRRLSKNNWREEFEKIEQDVKVLKIKFPNLYFRISVS